MYRRGYHHEFGPMFRQMVCKFWDVSNLLLSRIWPNVPTNSGWSVRWIEIVIVTNMVQCSDKWCVSSEMDRTCYCHEFGRVLTNGMLVLRWLELVTVTNLVQCSDKWCVSSEMDRTCYCQEFGRVLTNGMLVLRWLELVTVTNLVVFWQMVC